MSNSLRHVLMMDETQSLFFVFLLIRTERIWLTENESFSINGFYNSGRTYRPYDKSWGIIANGVLRRIIILSED